MAIPTPATATSRAGKPINVGDQVSVVANVVSFTGTGGAAVVVLNLPTSGGNITVTGADLYNAQTL